MSEKQYRKIRVDVFQHDKTRGLSAMAKLLMVYLTTPHYSGICVKSIAQMRNDIDEELPTEDVSRALDELVNAGVVQWDERFEVVWLVEAFDEQVCASSERHPNVAKGVMSHLKTLPAKSPIVRAFFERYGAWLRRSGAQLAGDPPALRVVEPVVASERPAKVDPSADPSAKGYSDPLPDPFGNPSVDPFGKGSADPFGKGSADPLGEPVAVNREQLTESRYQSCRDTGDPGSSRERRPSANHDDDNRGPPDGKAAYLEAERRIARAFEESLGLAVGPGAYQWAMERWQKGDATVDELLRVVAWWRDNRAEAGCQLRECFAKHGNGARWARIEALVLGRSPPEQRGGGGRGSGPQSRRRPNAAATRAAVRAHMGKQSTS